MITVASQRQQNLKPAETVNLHVNRNPMLGAAEAPHSCVTPESSSKLKLTQYFTPKTDPAGCLSRAHRRFIEAEPTAPDLARSILRQQLVIWVSRFTRLTRYVRSPAHHKL